MGTYCVISPGGAPGATTTALALALTWPRPVLLVEADLGGWRVVPAFVADRFDGAIGPGLLGLAMEAAYDPAHAAATVEDYAIPLTADGRALLLHGIRDPRQADQVAAAWEPLADVLTGFGTTGIDVIADAGRIGGAETPWPLLARSDVILMVLQPTLVSVDAARFRILTLREHLPHMTELSDQVAGRGRLGLCLIGDGDHTAAQVRRNLFNLPVLAKLPHAPKHARVLSEGAREPLTFRTGVLMRAAIPHLGQRLRRHVDERAFTPGASAAPPAFGGGSR